MAGEEMAYRLRAAVVVVVEQAGRQTAAKAKRAERDMETTMAVALRAVMPARICRKDKLASKRSLQIGVPSLSCPRIAALLSQIAVLSRICRGTQPKAGQPKLRGVTCACVLILCMSCVLCPGRSFERRMHWVLEELLLVCDPDFPSGEGERHCLSLRFCCHSAKD